MKPALVETDMKPARMFYPVFYPKITFFCNKILVNIFVGGLNVFVFFWYEEILYHFCSMRCFEKMKLPIQVKLLRE